MRYTSSIVMQNRWKIRFSYIPFLDMILYKFARFTTAQLQFQLQNFVAASKYEYIWEQNIIFVEFEWRSTRWCDGHIASMYRKCGEDSTGT